MAEEIWKDIDGFEGRYQISDRGRVKRLERYVLIQHPTKPYYRHLQELILTPNNDKDGYEIITLNADGKEKNMKIHRLVGIAFIDNPNHFDQINHKDGNKHNNNVSNLEWCDCRYNQVHAWETGLRETLKFAQIEKEENKIINIFDSLNDIRKSYEDIDFSTIIKVCRGKRNFHHGFRWAYADSNMHVGDVVDK